jgi:hypothetical protein
VAYIGLQAIERQNHVSLLLQSCLDTLLISNAQGNQFLIAVHQVRYTALSYADATRQEGLMHFRHTAMFAKTPLTNQGNYFQTEFAMWQRPVSFLLWSRGLVKAPTARLDTTFARRESTSRDQTVW